MKKILLSFSFLLCMLSLSKAQNIVIPDTIFRNYLLQNPDINLNGDTSITVAEAAAYTDTMNLWHFHVLTLDGIQYFTNITGLDCEGECCGILGLLRDLDVTHCTKLRWLNCFNNQLHTLDLSQNTLLQVLNCESNPLGELDLSHNSLLNELHCSSDSLSTINLAGAAQLEQVYITNNQLHTLDVSHNPLLKYLYCSDNNFTASIDLTHNPVLQELLCVNDQLSTLNISKNPLLDYMYCFTNPNLDSICVGSISYAEMQVALYGFVKDSATSWTESCKSSVQAAPAGRYEPFSVSPNPSSGQINFNGLNGANTIEVYDITGRKIYSTFSTSASFKIDFSEREKGIYMYKIIDANQKSVVGKIILQ